MDRVMERVQTPEYWHDAYIRFLKLNIDFADEVNHNFFGTGGWGAPGSTPAKLHNVRVDMVNDAPLVLFYAVLFFMFIRLQQWLAHMALKHTFVGRLFLVPKMAYVKFLEEVSGVTWHTFSFLVEVACLYHMSWWPTIVDPYTNATRVFWEGWPVLSISSGIKFLHLTQMGYYIQGVFTFLFVVRPKDFTTMMVHHFAAFTLICFSYMGGLLRVGTAIMVVHEVADVPLRISKLMHYGKWFMSSNIWFAIATLTWGVSRLIIYPRVVFGVCFEMPPETAISSIYFLRVLLVVLQYMHVVWFRMMVRILTNAVLGREDEELLKKGGDTPKGDRRRGSSTASNDSTRSRRNSSVFEAAALEPRGSFSGSIDTHILPAAVEEEDGVSVKKNR